MDNKDNNVAIFVDYDNVYWSLINNFNHDPDNEDKQKNLFEQLWKKYGRDNVRTFRVYADFEKIDTSMTSLQKKRLQIRHVYSNGKDGVSRKNSSDIELSIDAIESTYKDNNIGHYVFVTADSDMIPVLSRMMYKGKRVDLYYLSNALAQNLDLNTYVHYSEDLIKFLNVDVKNYNINEYISTSLKFIESWQIRNVSKPKTLGKAWLKDDFVKELGVPGNIASDIIEHLFAENYVFEDKKEINGSSRANINLTVEGKTLIEVTNEKQTEKIVVKS
jgi:uncharacterized LabA/DUF88 family protein